MAKAKSVDVGIRPLEDRVVVEPLEAEEKSAGGIYIPEAAKQKPQRGTVLAVGPGRRTESGELIPVSVSAGDVVVYGRYAGNDVEVNGRDLKVMRESDLLAKIS
ncbi:MAG: co-chaperone GroES [Planctomycetota bacterium]|jgi:chaperonin GroES|nr:MAG: co-chaperone GroES [Planctomycetota bacterium]RLS84403.1 MAG: co-chaperone GroES [Planctomycetota bacterium]